MSFVPEVFGYDADVADVVEEGVANEAGNGEGDAADVADDSPPPSNIISGSLLKGILLLLILVFLLERQE